MPVSFEEVEILFFRPCCLSLGKKYQVFAIVIRKKIGIALVIEIESCLPQVKLLTLQAVKERLDFFPLALGERGGLDIPATRSANEFFNNLMMNVGYAVANSIECSNQLVFGEEELIGSLFE